MTEQKEVANTQTNKQKELWNQIEQIGELQQIMKLKQSIKANREQRSNTKVQIKDLKQGYDHMKKHISQFLKEQNNSSIKMNAQRAMQAKKKQKGTL